MIKNMGTADRIIRLIIAAGVIALYNLHIVSGLPAVLLLILSAVFIITSFIGACLLYRPFGISTRNKIQE